MNRNISRRVELLFPIFQADIKQQILHIYDLMWRDNLKSRVLQPNGKYERVDRRGLAPLNVQEQLLAEAQAQRQAALNVAEVPKTQFTPMQKPQ